ncbi:MAG TPA: hypothetical protein VLX09_06735 [Stellaceae bacterium]|nr:hypothetical protein [Stellaceae bacterium]
MRKVLVVLTAAALLTNTAMAAERLTDQQMDSVTAGVENADFNSGFTITLINEPRAPSYVCENSGTCLVAVRNTFFPTAVPSTQLGFAVYSGSGSGL